MLTIHKYTFEVKDTFRILIPKDSTILKFDNQNEVPTIWALVDTEEELTGVQFYLFGTDMEIPEFPYFNYIGTAQFLNGQLVWHLFKE